MSDANSIQHGGDHYRSTLQHWDVMAEFFGLDYHIGCATKYVSRWKKKGTPLLDLKKALHFTQKAIECANDGAEATNRVPSEVVEEFVIANDLEMQERIALLSLWQWKQLEDLQRAETAIEALIREAEHAQGGPAKG